VSVIIGFARYWVHFGVQETTTEKRKVLVARAIDSSAVALASGFARAVLARWSSRFSVPFPHRCRQFRCRRAEPVRSNPFWSAFRRSVAAPRI